MSHMRNAARWHTEPILSLSCLHAVDGASLIVARTPQGREVDDQPFMQLLDPPAPGRLPVKILHVSQSGICIGSITFLPRGTGVRMCLGDIQLFGAIRYCVPAKEGFRADIELSGTIQAPQKHGFQQLLRPEN